MYLIEQRRRGFRLRSIAAALAAIAATATSVSAQQATLSGRVTGAADAPISETRVAVLGTTLVALTAADGKYTLRGVPTGPVEVRVFRVGYVEQKKSVTITAGGTATLDFKMEASTVKLDEFVVTATGIQRRAEVGNSISVINASERVKETPIHNMSDLLAAKAPGLTVLPTTMSGGGASIRIRGLNSVSRSNAPIFIIDGVRMDGGSGGFGVGGSNSSRLNDITPEEIEDIAVVKGPSAATLYGTDAANGVIIIKTKQGRRGKTQYQYTAERGIITDPNAYWDTFAIWGHTPAAPTVQTRCILTTIAAGACVQDSVTKANVMRNKALTPIGQGERSLYSMQVSGGSETVRFLISGNQERETGPIRLPDIDSRYLLANKVSVRDEWKKPEALLRTSIRVNLDATLSPKLDLRVNTSFIKSDQRLPQVDNNVNSFYYNAYTNPGFTQAYTCTAPCSGLGYSGIGNLGQPLGGWARRYSTHVGRCDRQLASVQLARQQRDHGCGLHHVQQLQTVPTERVPQLRHATAREHWRHPRIEPNLHGQCAQRRHVGPKNLVQSQRHYRRGLQQQRS